MTISQLIISVLLPILPLVLPGLLLVSPNTYQGLNRISHVFLWSLSSLILLTFVAASLGISNLWIAGLVLVICAIGYKFRFHELKIGRNELFLLAGLFASYLILSILFFYFHDALPTGDSQKAIFWGQYINNHSTLPNYDLAITTLNRDPVDFYTPGLHSITALLLRLAPAPLAAVGFFSLAAAVGVATVASATAVLLFPQLNPRLLTITTSFLIITSPRFLRYIREPGYHYQNIFGEFLLFGLLFIGLSLLAHKRWPDILLAGMIAGALLVTHQFSAFLAAFALLPLAILILFTMLRHRQWRKWHIAGLLAGALILAVALSFHFDLYQKIPHIFTLRPHLLAFVPPISDYPRTLGYIWVYGGIAGILLLIFYIKQTKSLMTVQLGFVLTVLILLLLSQGPRIGIDIPPVRALFYTVVPLSILTSLLLVRFIQTLGKNNTKFIGIGLVSSIVIISGITAAVKAYELNHYVRTNSTLTLDQQQLIEFLTSEQNNQGVLIDDYNRRSSSWLILADKPMYTRIASDLATQMSEASQSELRSQLYLNQLDFEKIYNLGSRPEVTTLLEKHNINWLTGISSSSGSAFAANPALSLAAQADGISLYQNTKDVSSPTLPLPATSWLLQATTLANDIGDEEDTFEHLPASLRTSRLSAPTVNKSHTYRTTNAPIIALRFNVGDYITPLWQQNNLQHPDTDLNFLISFAGSSNAQLRTATNHRQPLQNDNIPVRLKAHDILIEPDGFITLYIDNPQQHVLEIDLIALGLAPVS